MGEIENGHLRLDFDGHLRLGFRGAKGLEWICHIINRGIKQAQYLAGDPCSGR